MSKNALDEVVNRRLAERVPVLGVVSIATALMWIALVTVTGQSSLAASVELLFFQIGVFATAALLVRADQNARWTTLVAVIACLLSVYSWMVFFAVEGLSSVLHVFVLLTILLYAPLIVPWGWRAEAGLFAGGLAFYPMVLPYLHVRLPASERFVVFTAGAILSLAAAKWFTDVFRNEIRRQIEEEAMRRELVASRDAYRDLAEGARDQIWTADLEGRLTYVNEAFIRAFGSAESLIGSRIDDRLTDHPDNPDFASVVRAHAAGSNVSPVAVQIQSCAGPRWIEALVTPIEGPDGRMVGMRGIGRDITARRQAEEALRASEERYRALVESQRDLVVRYDDQGRLSFVNDAVCAKLCIARDTALGASLWGFVHPGDADGLRACMQRTRVPPYRGQVEIRVQTLEGWRWIEWEASAIRDEHGTVVEIQIRGSGRDRSPGDRRSAAGFPGGAAAQRGETALAGAASDGGARAGTQASQFRSARRRLPGAGGCWDARRVGTATIAGGARRRARRSEPRRGISQQAGGVSARARGRAPSHDAARTRTRAELARPCRQHVPP